MQGTLHSDSQIWCVFLKMCITIKNQKNMLFLSQILESVTSVQKKKE